MDESSIISFLYVLLALLGLGFLVFIHELGHYVMARRVGMKVDVFSIGFGKALYSWDRDGVKWQIGWLPFGGYVKIAGTETDEENPEDVYAIKNGFFGRGPWARIKVAFMGPFVNILFTLLAFTLLWVLGGREKSFAEHTKKIGWMDPQSELYQKGVRSGDEITAYNGQALRSAKDHLIAPMTAGGSLLVEGLHVDSETGEKKPFAYNVKPYANPEAFDKGLLTAGVLSPAGYLLYDLLPGQEALLVENSPASKSGIEYGDRIVWVDGERVFSLPQLTHVLNEPKVLLTIQRDQKILLERVPLVLVEELRLDPAVKEELTDWQFEAQLNQLKLPKMQMIPYNLNHLGVVESTLKWIDPEKEAAAKQILLQPGDKILAVNGVAITHSYQLFAELQQKKVNLIVQRSPKSSLLEDWVTADEKFDHEYTLQDLKALEEKVGRSTQRETSGNLVLLPSILPKKRKEMVISPEHKALVESQMAAQKEQVKKIEDPEERKRALKFLKDREEQWLIGLPTVQDKKVEYNPGPLELFGNVFEEIWQTLKALVSGSLSPKWMSGPIGIIQVVHHNSMLSLREALFWLGAISLNLGFLNLLPLPVLDGGTICFGFYEILTGKRLSPKTMEKWIIPFAIFLIGFFVFLTYNDVLRLFRG